ncbi:MAG: hypothetical protein ABGX83_02735 [Nitrospira sp.]|nr:hypothetical protein [Candidatus Manganitrophaceae bacterium]HIL34879.1 hypothetical protein [Candidatus Manganitrophaceae bacterium]
MSRKRMMWMAGLLIVLVGFANYPALADGVPETQALSTERPLVEPLPPPFFAGKEIPAPLPPEPVQPEIEETLPPQPDFWALFSNGMIVTDLQPDGEIRAAEDAKTMLGDGDIVYLKSFREEFVDEGQWVVFKTMKDVYHPKTKERLGDLVNVLGLIEVTHADKDSATAQIVHSKEPISRSDYIISVENLFKKVDLSDQALPENTEGTIVEVRDNRRSNAQHDIVYIDYGRNDGVVRGDRFSIIHSGQRSDFRLSRKAVGLPHREVGVLVVLSTQDRTATARIVESKEPISKGDSILFLSSR